MKFKAALLVVALIGFGFYSNIASADTITLKSGRKIVGEIVEETASAVKIKLKFGTVSYPRSQIKLVEKTGSSTTGSSAPGAKKAKNKRLFKNGFYDYQISCPDSDWLIKKTPPEPLTDVLLYHRKTDTEVSVSIQPDPDPSLKLEKASLKMFREGIESKLQEKFYNIKAENSESTQVAGQTAFRSRHTAVSRLTQRPVTLEEWLFKTRNRIYVVFASAEPVDYSKSKKSVEAIVDSIKIVDGKERDGQAFSSFDNFFTVQIPERWKFEKTATGCKLAEPNNAGQFVVRVEKSADRDALFKISEKRIKNLEPELKGFRKLSSSSENVLGTVAQQIDYQYLKAGKLVRAREVFIGSDQRLYHIEMSWDSSSKTLENDLRETLDDMVIQRNLTSRSSYEEGIKAIQAADRAHKALQNKNYQQAIDAYANAVEYFPNFATALNNMALCFTQLKAYDDYFKTMRKAYRLFPESRLLTENMGGAYNSRGISHLNQQKYKEAAADFERALRYLPDSEHANVRRNLGICHLNEGVSKLNEGQASAALASFKKAEKYDKNNPKLKKYLGNAYYHAAVIYYNKRQFYKAKTNAKKALKADPGHSQARALLNRIAEVKR